MSGTKVNNLGLDELTADPSPLSDGMFWYRSDLDEYRVRRNGVTESVALGASNTRNNYVLVKSASDFPAPVAGVITLADNTDYEINGIINLGTDRIVLGTNNKLYGQTAEKDQIVSSVAANALITGVDNNFFCKRIHLENIGVLGLIINLTGNGTNVIDIDHTHLHESPIIGTIAGGFSTIIINRSSIFGNGGGLTFTGTNEDLFIIDNTIEGFIGTPTAITLSGTVTYHTIFISRNMFEISAGQTGLDIDPNITFIGGGIISLNSFEDGGTYLTGIDASNPSWRIPSRSNVGIAGLFETTLVVNTDSYSGGVNYPSFGAVPETVVIGQPTDYEPNATTIKATLDVFIAYDLSGAGATFYFDLASWNNNTYTQVVGSETAVDFAGKSIFPVYYEETSAEFTLTPGQAYRSRIARHTGAGNPSTYMASAVLTIKVF
jgi:hypothetical protein